MNRKHLRISFFIATVTVGLFARSMDILHSRTLTPVQVPLRFDLKQEARGSFTPELDTEYFIGVALRSSERAEELVEAKPAVQWTITSNNATPVVCRPWKRRAYEYSGYEVGRFKGQAGVRYTVAATVKRPAPDVQPLNPELRVTVSSMDGKRDMVQSSILILCAGCLFLVSLGFLIRSFWDTPWSLRP